MVLRAAAVLVLMLGGAALAAPNIPASELPGRERERFFDGLMQPAPRIELQDGSPKAVINTGKKRPAKPKKRRAPRGR